MNLNVNMQNSQNYINYYNYRNRILNKKLNCMDSVSFGIKNDSKEAALKILNKYKPEKPEHIIFVTDPNRDPDDLESFVIASELEERGFIKVDAAITTLGNKETRKNRAQFAKGAFEILGINAPVGAGSDYVYGDNEKAQKRYDNDDQKFLDDKEISNKTIMCPDIEEKGKKLFIETLKNAEDKSLNIVIIAGMRDVANLIENNEDLFIQKVKCLSIMGGVKNNEFDENGYLIPDEKAYNNATDFEAAKIVYKKAQELNIPIRITNKKTAYSVPVPKEFYKELNETQNPVGKYLYGIQKTALNGLWNIVKAGMIPILTPEWFINTFTSLDLENENHKKIFEKAKNDDEPFETMWNNVSKFNLYDPINLLAGILPEQNDFFRNTKVNQEGNSTVEVVTVQNADKVRALLSELSKNALK